MDLSVGMKFADKEYSYIHPVMSSTIKNYSVSRKSGLCSSNLYAPFILKLHYFSWKLRISTFPKDVWKLCVCIGNYSHQRILCGPFGWEMKARQFYIVRVTLDHSAYSDIHPPQLGHWSDCWEWRWQGNLNCLKKLSH